MESVHYATADARRHLARHALGSEWVGRYKADALREVANQLVLREQTSSIVSDVLAPREKLQELEVALSKATAILDCTASVPIARHLATRANTSRVMSAFLNPAGDTLVFLAEDEKPTCRLDLLEMQYYRTRPAESDFHRPSPNDFQNPLLKRLS